MMRYYCIQHTGGLAFYATGPQAPELILAGWLEHKDQSITLLLEGNTIGQLFKYCHTGTGYFRHVAISEAEFFQAFALHGPDFDSILNHCGFEQAA